MDDNKGKNHRWTERKETWMIIKIRIMDDHIDKNHGWK